MARSPEDKATEGSRKRLRVEFGDGADAERVELVRPRNASNPDGAGIILKSAALLWQSNRIPIPAAGLALGRDPGDVSTSLEATQQHPGAVETTADGHVVVARTGRGDVYVNGEQLVDSERRPLARGDSIAVGDNMLYYLPAGQFSQRLPSIVPERAGRLKRSKQEMVIGRDENCDLTLDYPTVSRRHAVIKSGKRGSVIEDCGSATGLRINGISVKKSALETGDEIAIGPFRIVFDGEELVERAAADGLPVEARAATVTIEETTILQPTDLSLRGGELVALIGESGAGKTTLLKALAGVSEPSSGQILCGGEPVSSRMSEIGYVPQFDIVHGQLTVYEALDFAAQLRLPEDTSADERHQRVTSVIAQLGLTERAELRVDRLSGGQRKRVAVGIELLHRPGAIFLDEPTTGLDPGLERMMMELFRELADAGQTVSLVTHATGSMSLCDRVIVMGRGGVKRFDGAPADLLKAFNVDHFDDVYARLASGDSPRIDLRDAGQEPAPSGRTRERARPQVRQSLSHQTRVLATRYATLMSRDRKNLISIAIQTVVLGLLTAMIFRGDVFEFPPDAAKSLTAKAAQLIFLMVTISIWMGSIASAREIVKERSVVSRELAVGVQLNAYIASKLIVLLSLVTIQVFAYFMIVTFIKPTGTGEMTLLAILILSGWVAVMLGLVVSAWAESEDQATGLIPILLVPQLLFGGALVTLHEMPSFVGGMASVIPSRWAYDAAGTAISMGARMGHVPPSGRPIASSKGLQEGYGPDFFHLEIFQFMLIVGVFFIVLFGLLSWMINRPGKGHTT